MTPEQRQTLQAHVTEIAKILHADSVEQGMSLATFGEIEQTVRRQILDHMSPDLGLFLSQLAQEQPQETPES